MIRRLLAGSLLCLTAQSVLCVVIGDAFAAVPIQLGETQSLGYFDNGNANLLPVQGPYNLNTTAVLQSLSFWVGHAAGELYLGIYDSGPNNDCRGGRL